MSTGSSYPSFLFDPLRHWLDQLPPRPDSAALVALAEQHPRQVASGQRIRFVPPQADGTAYECRIWERGEVADGICPHCGAPLTENTVLANPYIEEGYLKSWNLYREWLAGTLNHALLILELGVDFKTPTVIRWPWRLVST